LTQPAGRHLDDELVHFPQAGKMIRDGQAKRFSQDSATKEKLNSVDLVTEVDQAVEAFLIKSIETEYPKHKL
jgi:myo-inositol-1(or 4)-monophosphatase